MAQVRITMPPGDRGNEHKHFKLKYEQYTYHRHQDTLEFSFEEDGTVEVPSPGALVHAGKLAGHHSKGDLLQGYQLRDDVLGTVFGFVTDSSGDASVHVVNVV